MELTCHVSSFVRVVDIESGWADFWNSLFRFRLSWQTTSSDAWSSWLLAGLAVVGMYVAWQSMF
jgi:hypothetical protein